MSEELVFTASKVKRIFSYPNCEDQPPHQCISGALLGIKWTVCEAEHSPPSSVDVEAVPPLTYVIMARCPIKHRYNCISQLCFEYKQKYLPNCLKILNERLFPTLQSKVIF
jgi:hypothetical protein